jgi:hypothetical protein
MNESQQFIQTIGNTILPALNIDTILYENNLVRSIESKMDSKKVLDMHFDFAVSGNSKKLAEYYANALSKKNDKILNEVLKNISELELNEFNESLEEFRNFLKAIAISLNEQSVVNPFAGNLLPGFDDAITGLGTAAASGAKSSIISGLKSFWDAFSDAATQGGTPLGYLQLFLDVVGLLGDAIIPGIGILADGINAAIYYYNKQWFLMTISIISMVPFVGDAAKVLKPSAGIFSKIFKLIGTGGSIIKYLMKLPLGILKGVMNGLKFILKHFGNAISWISKKLKGVFSSINKTIGKIPFIGSKISGAFTKLGNLLNKVLGKANTFKVKLAKVQNEIIPLVAKTEKKALDDVYLKLSKNGGTIKYIESPPALLGTQKGTAVLEYTPKGGTPVKIPLKTVIDANSELGKKFAGSSVKNTLKYEKAKAKMPSKLISNLKSLGVWIGAKGKADRLNKSWLVFFGKQIAKYYTIDKDGGGGSGGDDGSGEDGVPTQEISDLESTFISSTVFTDYAQRVTIQRQKETGVVYNPAVVFNSDEQEAYDYVTGYNNNYAKMFGQPSIVPVLYDDIKGNEQAKKVFDNFFSDIAAGKKASAPTTNAVTKKEISVEQPTAAKPKVKKKNEIPGGLKLL